MALNAHRDGRLESSARVPRGIRGPDRARAVTGGARRRRPVFPGRARPGAVPGGGGAAGAVDRAGFGHAEAGTARWSPPRGGGRIARWVREQEPAGWARGGGCRGFVRGSSLSVGQREGGDAGTEYEADIRRAELDEAGEVRRVRRDERDDPVLGRGQGGGRVAEERFGRGAGRRPGLGGGPAGAGSRGGRRASFLVDGAPVGRRDPSAWSCPKAPWWRCFPRSPGAERPGWYTLQAGRSRQEELRVGEYTGRRRGRAASEPSAQQPEYRMGNSPIRSPMRSHQYGSRGRPRSESRIRGPNIARSPRTATRTPLAMSSIPGTSSTRTTSSIPGYGQQTGYQPQTTPAILLMTPARSIRRSTKPTTRRATDTRSPRRRRATRKRSYTTREALQQGPYYEEPYAAGPMRNPPQQSRHRSESAPAAESYAEPYAARYPDESPILYRLLPGALRLCARAPMTSADSRLRRSRAPSPPAPFALPASPALAPPLTAAATAALAVAAFVSTKAIAAVVLPLQLIVAYAVLDLAGFASRRTAVLVALPGLAGQVLATFTFQPDDAALPIAAGLGAGFVLIAADAVVRARRRGVEPGSLGSLAASDVGAAVRRADRPVRAGRGPAPHLGGGRGGRSAASPRSWPRATPNSGRAGPRWSRYRSRSPPSLRTPRLSSSHDFRGGARSAAVGGASAARQTPPVAHQAGDHAARARGSVRGRRPDHRGDRGEPDSQAHPVLAESTTNRPSPSPTSRS